MILSDRHKSDFRMLTERVLLVRGMYYVDSCVAAFHIHCTLGSNNHDIDHGPGYDSHRGHSPGSLYLVVVLDELVIHLTFLRHIPLQRTPVSTPYYRKPTELSMFWLASHCPRPMNTALALERSFVLATNAWAMYSTVNHYLYTIHLDNNLCFFDFDWFVCS